MGISQEHWDRIKARILKADKAFRDRDSTTILGRTIPEDDDLLIGEGRYLNLAVLFLDICSFTSWPSGNQAEQKRILEIFNLFMNEMMRIASDFGGQVEKNTGDGLMAYFSGSGDNVARNACENAISAALTMKHTTANVIGPMLAAKGLGGVQFRIGIDFGPVTIARVGPARLFNSNVAIGSTANIANRILSKAQPGEVWLGEMVVNELADNWKALTELILVQTGFVYQNNQAPYPYYRYNGVWVHLK